MQILKPVIRPLEWESNYFGVRTSMLAEADLDDDALADALRQARGDGVQLLVWPALGGRIAPRCLCDEFNGMLVDRKATFSKAIRAGGAALDSLPDDELPVIRYTAATASAELCDLAIAAGAYSRFKVDPHIQQKQFEGMYRRWIDKSVQGELANVVLIAALDNGHADTRRLGGMITLAESHGVASIGLLAVASEMRGRGIGSTLMRTAHCWMSARNAHEARVVTQLANAAACRLYERCGYSSRRCSTTITFGCEQRGRRVVHRAPECSATALRGVRFMKSTASHSGRLASQRPAFDSSPAAPCGPRVQGVRLADTREAVDLSVVIPVYNSATMLPQLLARLRRILNDLDMTYELVLVDDGSPDDSWRVLSALQQDDPDNITAVQLMRNYGQHNALMCGFRHARGTLIVTMDDDLQHPPEEIPKLLDAIIANDLDLVYGCYDKKKHAGVKNAGSAFVNMFFRRVFRLPVTVTAFRIFRRELLAAILGYTRPFTFIDGLLAWNTRRVGTTIVEHHPRPVGKSGYSLAKMVTLALNLFTNFSLLPLQIVSLVGSFAAACGLLMGIYYLILHFTGSITTPGYASIIVSILTLGGLQLLGLGIIGEYLGRLHLNVNAKPQYWERQVLMAYAEDQTNSGPRPTSTLFGVESDSAGPAATGQQT